MSELIKKWLNGTRNYTVGTILYNQFGHDEAVKKQLATGKSDYTAKVLLESINKLLNGDEVKTAIEKQLPVHELMPDDADMVLQALKNEWMPLYTQMNYKRHELDKYLEDETDAANTKRGTLAMEILTLEKQCISIWQKRDHYLKHKTLPGKNIDTEPVIGKFEAANRISNLKIYVRRYKNILSRLPGDANAAQLLNTYEKELKHLQDEHGK